MHNTFKTCTLLLVFSLSAFVAYTQPGGRGPQGIPAEMAKRQTDLMVEKLELSEAQALKAQEINLQFAEKMKAARDSMPEGDWTVMRQKMTVLREQQDAELKKILTSDQWTAYVKLREEQRAQREARRKQDN